MGRPIPEIQEDLKVAYQSRRKALEAASYSQNSGQGSISVSRNLTEINKTISSLETELENAQANVNGCGDVLNFVFDGGVR